jgi:hypothetical protein
LHYDGKRRNAKGKISCGLSNRVGTERRDMSTLINPQFIIVLFVLIRAGDIAISAAIARDAVRSLLYGIVAILALVFVVLALVGH